MSSDKPTLTLARRMAKEKGHEHSSLDVGKTVLSMWNADMIADEYGRMIEVYAPTRTAALAGLIAVIKALPDKGKR